MALNKLKTGTALSAQIAEQNDNIATIESHLAEKVSQKGGVHGLIVERGTFTPTLSTTNNDGLSTESGTYGDYIRIGDMVHINLRMNIESFSGGTGYWQINGLPFAASSRDRYNMVSAANNLGGSNIWSIRYSSIMPKGSNGAGAIPVESFSTIRYIHVSGVYQIG